MAVNPLAKGQKQDVVGFCWDLLSKALVQYQSKQAF